MRRLYTTGCSGAEGKTAGLRLSTDESSSFRNEIVRIKILILYSAPEHYYYGSSVDNAFTFLKQTARSGSMGNTALKRHKWRYYSNQVGHLQTLPERRFSATLFLLLRLRWRDVHVCKYRQYRGTTNSYHGQEMDLVISVTYLTN